MTIGDLQHCYLMLTQILKKDLDEQEHKAVITAMAVVKIHIEDIEAESGGKPIYNVAGNSDILGEV